MTAKDLKRRRSHEMNEPDESDRDRRLKTLDIGSIVRESMAEGPSRPI